MSGYTSGALEPWVVIRWDGVEASRHATKEEATSAAIWWTGSHVVHAPRSEFDLHNPILSDFRRDVAGAPMGEQVNDLDDYRWLIGPDWENFWQDHITEAHIDHARRVLAKLAFLTMTPNGVTD